MPLSYGPGAATDTPGRIRRHAKAAKTATSVAAIPYQVSAYCRWVLGRESRVWPPRGQPPGFGVASAST